MRGIVLAVVGLAGCVTGFREMRATLPPEESRAFDACYSYVNVRACGGAEGLKRSHCMSDVAEQYTRLPDRAARRTMLVEGGCPSPVVDGVLAQR